MFDERSAAMDGRTQAAYPTLSRAKDSVEPAWE